MAFFSPTPDRSECKRQAFGSPTCLSLSTSDLTPADSGYGSTFVSPKNLRRWDTVTPLWDIPGRSTLFELLDGNGSPDTDAISTSSDDTAGERTFNTPPPKDDFLQRPRSASATLPHRAARSRPTLPAAFFSESNARATDHEPETRPRRPKSGSLRAPDRFVPLRDTKTPVSEIFRITKGISQLSTHEKLLRNDSAASDAFVYRRRLVSPMASDYRLISRSDTGAVRSRGVWHKLRMNMVQY